MCGQAMSPDTPNAISSPELPAGPTRSGLRDGMTMRPSGPGPVPVSRFRSLDSERAMPINDTSGPLFTNSSPSAALQRYLENKLRQRMGVNGSPEYVLIWKALDMPSGVPICVLRASGRRIPGTDFIGLLPTPSAREGRDWSRAAILASLDHGGCVARRICNLSQTIRSSRQIVGLNPSFALWMMGYPPAWINCAVPATPSSRKSRRSS